MVHLVVERLAEGILAASQGQLHKGLLEGRRQNLARLCPSSSIISPLPEGSHQGVHQPGKGGCVQAGFPVVLGPCSHSSYSLPCMRQVSSKEVWAAVYWNRVGACSCAVGLLGSQRDGKICRVRAPMPTVVHGQPSRFAARSTLPGIQPCSIVEPAAVSSRGQASPASWHAARQGPRSPQPKLPVTCAASSWAGPEQLGTRRPGRPPACPGRTGSRG